MTENVSSISLSGSEMVTSFGGNKTIQPWSPTWNSAIPVPDTDGESEGEALLVAIIEIVRSPKASSSNE